MRGFRSREGKALYFFMGSSVQRVWQPVRRTRARWGRWLAARPGFPRVPEVTYHDIQVERLPGALEGLRIVQLSDVHHGLYVSRVEVEQAVEVVNYLRPDLVVLTGDFVTQSWVHIEPMAQALGRLGASRGVFAVMGNHDHRAGAESVEQHLTRQGIHVLRNRHTMIGQGPARLCLVGVDDFRYNCNLPLALRGIPAGVPRILLCHNPAIIPYAAREGIDFVVSGHTHGGQIHLPWLGPVYPRQYQSGLHRVRGTQIYVSRGIGKVVVPVRLGCPPEIPVFHLRSSLGDRTHSHASC